MTLHYAALSVYQDGQGSDVIHAVEMVKWEYKDTASHCPWCDCPFGGTYERYNVETTRLGWFILS